MSRPDEQTTSRENRHLLHRPLLTNENLAIGATYAASTETVDTCIAVSLVSGFNGARSISFCHGTTTGGRKT